MKHAKPAVSLHVCLYLSVCLCLSVCLDMCTLLFCSLPYSSLYTRVSQPIPNMGCRSSRKILPAAYGSAAECSCCESLSDFVQRLKKKFDAIRFWRFSLMIRFKGRRVRGTRRRIGETDQEPSAIKT